MRAYPNTQKQQSDNFQRGFSTYPLQPSSIKNSQPQYQGLRSNTYQQQNIPNYHSQAIQNNVNYPQNSLRQLPPVPQNQTINSDNQYNKQNIYSQPQLRQSQLKKSEYNSLQEEKNDQKGNYLDKKSDLSQSQFSIKSLYSDYNNQNSVSNLKQEKQREQPKIENKQKSVIEEQNGLRQYNNDYEDNKIYKQSDKQNVNNVNSNSLRSKELVYNIEEQFMLSQLKSKGTTKNKKKKKSSKLNNNTINNSKEYQEQQYKSNLNNQNYKSSLNSQRNPITNSIKQVIMEKQIIKEYIQEFKKLNSIFQNSEDMNPEIIKNPLTKNYKEANGNYFYDYEDYDDEIEEGADQDYELKKLEQLEQIYQFSLKYMQKFGYVYGQGLGKYLHGKVKPVIPKLIYYLGKYQLQEKGNNKKKKKDGEHKRSEKEKMREIQMKWMEKANQINNNEDYQQQENNKIQKQQYFNQEQQFDEQNRVKRPKEIYYMNFVKKYVILPNKEVAKVIQQDNIKSIRKKTDKYIDVFIEENYEDEGWKEKSE